MDLTLLEPESDFLLGVLDAVGTVADVASDINGEVTTDGTWGGCERVGGAEENLGVSIVGDGEGRLLTTAGLDSITTLPNHSADWSGTHVYYMLDVFRMSNVFGKRMGMDEHTLDESWEEWLSGEILVCNQMVSRCPVNNEELFQRTVLLEVLLGSGHQLDGSKLVSSDVSQEEADQQDGQLTHEPQIGR